MAQQPVGIRSAPEPRLAGVTPAYSVARAPVPTAQPLSSSPRSALSTNVIHIPVDAMWVREPVSAFPLLDQALRKKNEEIDRMMADMVSRNTSSSWPLSSNQVSSYDPVLTNILLHLSDAAKRAKLERDRQQEEWNAWLIFLMYLQTSINQCSEMSNMAEEPNRHPKDMAPQASTSEPLRQDYIEIAKVFADLQNREDTVTETLAKRIMEWYSTHPNTLETQLKAFKKLGNTVKKIEYERRMRLSVLYPNVCKPPDKERFGF